MSTIGNQGIRGPELSRRRFLGTAAVVAGAPVFIAAPKPSPAGVGSIPDPEPTPARPEGENRGRILKSVKIGMTSGLKMSFEDKLRVLQEIGYDGLELNSPSNLNLDEAVAASRKLEMPLHGVVDSVHWQIRLSDPDAAVREKGYQALCGAIRDSHQVGGTSVLLVPGVADNAETSNHDQVWERSIEQIRRALPLAARLGIHILIENVWNRFLYVHDGPDDQTADLLAAYLDAIDSPWVGSYFDIGNHQKYGKPADWIRRLGRRIVKLDVKDWGKEKGWAKIGEGDVDWVDVRAALAEIGFTGWSTAEVGGGGEERLREVAANMDRVLGL